MVTQSPVSTPDVSVNTPIRLGFLPSLKGSCLLDSIGFVSFDITCFHGMYNNLGGGGEARTGIIKGPKRLTPLQKWPRPSGDTAAA